MYVVVLDIPGAPHDEVIGPFDTERDALFFEDLHVDAPAGSRAHIVRMLSPVAYARGRGAGSEGEEPDREPSAEQERAWDEQHDGTSLGR